MISPERVEALQGQWVRLVARWGVTPAAAYPVFDRLVAAHAEPHRHYHTLEHVAEVLRVAGRLGASPAVLLAVWFHDAVYDPRAADNEERSATLAAELLGGLGVPAVERVADLIRATTHAAGPADAETAVLLDADLAILGAAEVRYRRYAADIRREYAHVPDDAYRHGRAAVLRAFLARERIYRTEVMFAEGEAAARRNLADELAGLAAAG
jgi:predicted metal-dependent HD superfamily phosphohydrolase